MNCLKIFEIKICYPALLYINVLIIFFISWKSRLEEFCGYKLVLSIRSPLTRFIRSLSSRNWKWYIIYSFRDKLLERYGQDIWQESGKEYLQLREVRQIQIKIFKICENYLPAKDSGYIIISQPNANPLCPIIITQAHQFLVRQKTQLQKNLLQIGTLGVFRNIVVASIAPTSDIGQKENHYTVSCSAFEGLPYLS